jgi:threonyl-tRNA synthetase
MKKQFSDEILRHSAAHLLAQAIFELYPETIFTLGPATETGFFYDILPKENFKEADLDKISHKMKQICKRDTKIMHRHISKKDGITLFKNNPFKMDIIENQIKDDIVGITEQDTFVDLCRGGHVPSARYLEHFMLTGISGSYWRGNREGQVLQRISGIVFETAQELEDYKKKLEWAELYDHRRLGKEMDLFSFMEEGPGFPFLHPKGMVIVNQLQSFMRDLTKKANYQEVRTPTMLSSSLWKQSGHYAHYKDNMYFSMIDEQEFAIKPMNCPGAFLIFGSRPRSYRELPLRLSEMGHVHRHELSGALHGLFRVRAFTQDDAHIFCKLSDIHAEITTILEMIDIVLQKTGFADTEIYLSTKPEKAFGEEKLWNDAINILKKALDKHQKPYQIKEGDGAFYGPKIEIKVKDIFNRLWTCGTIQLDFFQPQNFDLNYVTSEGTMERPVIIHQAIFGSFERFLGMLLEHHKGHVPVFLAPVQAKVLPITTECKAYAEGVYQLLKEMNIRVDIDLTGDPLNALIQRAQKERIPYMIIIGKQEVQDQKITVRIHNGSQLKLVDIKSPEFISLFA